MIRRAVARIAEERRGATLVEFALVVPVMIMLLMGLMDLTYRLYVQSILNGAMQQAARAATLETAATQLPNIDGFVSSSVRQVAPDLKWASTRKAYNDYSSIGPEPFIDINGNGKRDPGECYSDTNANGKWDADPGKTGNGGARDSVVYTMKITYPRLFPMAGLLGWNAQQDISSTMILKNQPYNATNAPAPVTRCL